MPITINPPVDNLFVGPGHVVQAQSNNQTPLPGAYWELSVTNTGTEVPLSGAVNRFSSQASTEFWIGVDVTHEGAYAPAWNPVAPRAAAPSQSAQLTVRLRDATGLVIEQTTTPVQWYPEPTGVAFVQSLAATSSSLGFTAADRADLVLVKGAVWREQTPTLTGALPAIGQAIDLLRGLPRSLIRRGPFVTIQGNGTMPAVPSVWNSSSGIEWAINQLPPGFGKDNGQVIEWHPRLAQFVVIRRDAFGNDYIDQVVDTHAADEFITWQSPAPIQIRYDLPPGVVLTVYYLGAVVI